MKQQHSDQPGLYVHLPFCSAICPYCDFYVLTGERQHRVAFVEHLRLEIELCARRPWPSFVASVPARPFDTLYLGGGTPSLLAPDDLAALLSTLQRLLPFVDRPWIGIEANPEDVTASNLAAWRELGTTFLSLGIQSFTDRNLQFLGRRHNASTSRASVELAVASGIDTVSLDLIYGLPEQSESDWHLELETALALAPDHLSCYQLTIEPRTPFGFRRDRGQLLELAPDRQADLFYQTHRQLADRGMEPYEVSNFATAPEHRSRHNLKYWHHVPYLGLGPSAHSFAPPHRWWNLRKIRPWEDRLAAASRPIEAFETLTSDQLVLEHLALGLRTPAGIDLAELDADTRAAVLEKNRAWLDRLAAADLAHLEASSIRPTLAGLAMADSLVRGFELPPTRAADDPGIC